MICKAGEFLGYVLTGVTSFGPKVCGQPNFPGVYSRVPYYMDWIKENMEGTRNHNKAILFTYFIQNNNGYSLFTNLFSTIFTTLRNSMTQNTIPSTFFIVS